MKAVVYYFTGTGNNLATAMQLKKELGNTDIFPIKELENKKDIGIKYDWVIFSVPSYYSHIPPFVEKCLRDLRYASHQKIVTIVACGGNRGLATQDLRQLISRSEKEVMYEYMIRMSGSYIINYPGLPNWYNASATKSAKKKISQIVRDIKQNAKRKQLKVGGFYKDKYEESLQKAINNYSNIAKNYEVSSECTNCETCIKVCPVNNVENKSGKIMFGDNCQQCMACIQWCPKKAIDYQGKTKNRKRYHHSDISLQTLIELQDNSIL